MCTNNFKEGGSGWSPDMPVTDEKMVELCIRMKEKIEAQTGSKFSYYQPLVYRRAPWLGPNAGVGPVIFQYDLLIKVATTPNSECMHMVVHVDDTVKTETLSAFQLNLEINALMVPIYIDQKIFAY